MVRKSQGACRYASLASIRQKPGLCLHKPGFPTGGLRISGALPAALFFYAWVKRMRMVATSARFVALTA